MKLPGWIKRNKPPLRQAKFTIEETGYTFRRSRTLTGTTSQDIAPAAAEPRNHLKSPRLKLQELRKKRRSVLISLLVTMFAGVAGIWFLDQYILEVQVEITGVSTPSDADAKKYKKLLSDYLGARPIERFRFALDESSLSEYLRAQAPEVVSSMVADASGLVQAKLAVQPRRALAVWQISGHKYYVDSDGVTFEKQYYDEPTLVVKDESGAQSVDAGKLVASNSLLSFLGQVVAGVGASGVGTVESVTIPRGALRELDIMLKGRGYRFKTHIDREPTGQVFDVVTMVKFLDAKGITPEYVDARVPGRAYYK